MNKLPMEMLLTLRLPKGTWDTEDVVLTRIHSSKITNDLLGTLTGSIRKGLDDIFKLINKSENGAVLFINQEQAPEEFTLSNSASKANATRRERNIVLHQ